MLAGAAAGGWMSLVGPGAVARDDQDVERLDFLSYRGERAVHRAVCPGSTQLLMADLPRDLPTP